MLRKLAIVLISLAFCWTTVACSSPGVAQSLPKENSNIASAPNQLNEGQYPVQQATYDDINGEYSLMLLNTPLGTSPVFRATDLQLASLTDEEISAGQKTYLKIDNGQAVMYLKEDFRIEYVHNVTETQTNPQTGQPETVIVRQQSSFWTPFAGALAGQALGSLLFTPRYYMPPVYQSGLMAGYGGYGSTYNQAVQQYQNRYQTQPPAVKNRQSFRTTGRLSKSKTNKSTTAAGKASKKTNLSTGSGFGSSNLRQSGKMRPKQVNRPNRFGSGMRSRSSSFGSRRSFSRRRR
ncbi:MAG: DUF1190 domain-containing protein [Symploca sp. SIO2G7]|nr:DUF1190 domain-containing protein [Symploca sp. SIO2G7]